MLMAQNPVITHPHTLAAIYISRGSQACKQTYRVREEKTNKKKTSQLPLCRRKACEECLLNLSKIHFLWGDEEGWVWEAAAG